MRKSGHSLKGTITAEISGQALGKFLSECTKHGVSLRNVRPKNEQMMICQIKCTNPELLKRLLRETNCRIHILEKRGIPFFVRRVRSRLGFAAGIIFFLAILLLLSNMVWSIQVKGADPRLETQIRNLLTRDHLFVGSLNFFVPNTKEIEEKLSANLPKVTWIGVSRAGTTYRVDVVQKKYPKKAKSLAPRNLVAAKQAVIHHLYVEKGQPVVESNQFVKAGQALVLGRIGDEKSFRFVPAKGRVIGETWYESQAQIPLESRYTLYTGRSKTNYRLRFWHLSVPLWGLNKHPYTNTDKETRSRHIRFLLWKLPVTFIQDTFREKKPITRRLTIDQALAEAEKTADRKLLGRLSPNAEILSTVIDKKEVRDGILYITSHEVVLEDIARPQTIDVGKEKERLKRQKKSG
ncbi:MAG: sporulation protein YqfD [Sporolactobacillus sp.]